MKIPWDKYETAILIDMYWKIEEGMYDKKTGISVLSYMLRKRAKNNGVDIDDTFRNENGITLQLNSIEYIFTSGRKGLKKPPSKIYSSMCDLYNNNRAEFDNVLFVALVSVKDFDNLELFELWLKNNKVKISYSVILEYLEEIDQFCTSRKIIKDSIFDSLDAKVIISVQNQVKSNHFFRNYVRMVNRININDVENSINLYKNFILFVNETLENFTLEFSTTEPIVEEPKDEVVESEASDYSVVNFEPQEDYAFTTPFEIIIFDEKKSVSNWKEVYVTVIRNLYSYYPNLIDSLKGTHIGSGKRMDFGSEEQYSLMVSPKEVAPLLYAETNLSANDIVKKISALYEICDSDISELVIKYKKQQKKSATISETKETSGFRKWLEETKYKDSIVDAYCDAIRRILEYIDDHELKETNDNLQMALSQLNISKNEKLIMQSALRKYIQYRSLESNKKVQDESTKLYSGNSLYHKLLSISKIYRDPNGLTLDRIIALIQHSASKQEVSKILDREAWAVKIGEELYSFSKDAKPQTEKTELVEVYDDFDKEKYVQVLLNRYSNGMQFDSIDFENFRIEYNNFYSELIEFSDSELEKRLRQCGFMYMDRLFPAAGVIDDGSKEKLYNYIDKCFATGNSILYYKSIYNDLSDVFVYCFSLADEVMLKEYIKFTSEEGKYYFYDDFMSNQKDVKMDHSEEISSFILNAGKPLSYDEIFSGLSHISQDVIYDEIRTNKDIMLDTAKHYFHIGIFEASQEELDMISSLIENKIIEDGYAIWTGIYESITVNMPLFIENNAYLSQAGLKNIMSLKLSSKYHFEGKVISTKDKKLNTDSVYRAFAKTRDEFTYDELTSLAKELDTLVYYDSIYEESVRVREDLFINKKCINIDVDEADKALNFYMSGTYVAIKDVDSFTVFPNVGYEWNQYLLEGFLISYSKKFTLLNNGFSSKNVAGAIVKKDGTIKEFKDLCALVIAESGIELTKDAVIEYLHSNNYITRRTYRDVDYAIKKARLIRNSED